MKNSEKAKNILENHYGPSGKRVKNAIKQRYGRIGTSNNQDFEGLRISRTWPLSILKWKMTTVK